MGKPIIEKIEAHLRKNDTDWSSVAQALNPLKFISENIVQITHYRIEMKRINAEIKRVEAEKDIRIEQINSAKEILLRDIETRANGLHQHLQIVGQALKEQHIQKMELIKSITSLNELIASDKVSLDERVAATEALTIVAGLLTDFGKEATIQLQQIANSTMKSLDAIPNYKLLLLDA